jgi:hypothetical protein
VLVVTSRVLVGMFYSRCDKSKVEVDVGLFYESDGAAWFSPRSKAGRVSRQCPTIACKVTIVDCPGIGQGSHLLVLNF